MSEQESKVFITLLDKGLLALIFVIVGFFMNRALEEFKTQQQMMLDSAREERTAALESLRSDRALQNDLSKLRVSKDLEYSERQLSELYWPVYTYLEIDRSLWAKIYELRRGNERDKQLADRIQDEYIVPNDDEILKLIKSKNQLSETDPVGIDLAKRFIKEAAVFRIERALAKESGLPPQVLRDQSWREDFYKHTVATAWVVQNRYERLKKSMGARKVLATQ